MLMINDVLRYLVAFGIVGGLMLLVVVTIEGRLGRWAMLVLWALVLSLLFSLSGCSSTPPRPAEPPPLPAPILCAAPPGMTEAQAEPDRPAGELTQRDVASYLLALHRWGWRGWRQLQGVRDYAAQCRSNATDEQPEAPRE